MAKKSKAQLQADRRSAAAQKGWATRKAEARRAAKEARARSAAARRGWETRKANAAAKAKPARPAATPTKPEPSRARSAPGGGGGGGRTAPVGAPPQREQPRYAPEFEGLDDFYGGEEYGEEDEY